MNGGADRWIRRTTTGCVALLALIAGTVSYLHMHLLVELHGEPGWVAALTPLSVDGMIVHRSILWMQHQEDDKTRDEDPVKLTDEGIRIAELWQASQAASDTSA